MCHDSAAQEYDSSLQAEQIPFGKDAGTEEADELILMPILVKILSEQSCCVEEGKAGRTDEDGGGGREWIFSER